MSKDMIILFSSLVVLLIFIILAYGRLVFSFNAHEKIDNAIYLYRMQCFVEEDEPLVDYSDMESFVKTMLRICDFGYSRILPPDKFELVKDYII